MQVRLREISFRMNECRTRLPFRFGVHTMTQAPMMTARAEIDTDAGPGTGFSAELLVPKWFEKNPASDLRADAEGLVQSARKAAEVARARTASTVFELWWRTYSECLSGVSVDAPGGLRAGFGVALVERAILDAACRAAEMSFFEALKSDLFALRPAALYPELGDWSPAQSLPASPAARIAVRHTIGLVDALRASEVRDRVDDGLPEALDEDIRRYGLRYFKLKLSGDLQADLERTLEFAAVLRETGTQAAQFTVDGNEQFEDPAALLAFFETLDREPGGRQLLEKLLYIEQPLHRARSLKHGVAAGLAALSEIAPVIIDESDHGIEAFPRALDLGYGGVSVKNCKGVLRALMQRGLCERRGGFQSGEDLTNLGVLALQQDLATMAALDLGHVERNGHHYFAGLGHLSRIEASAALEAHPDLWESNAGTVSLAISDGELQLDSIQTPGFGYAGLIDWEARTPLEDWHFSER